MHDDSHEYPPLTEERMTNGDHRIVVHEEPTPSVNLTEAQIVRLQDGDLLVFRATERLSPDDMDRLNERLQWLEASIEARTGKKIKTIGIDVDLEFPRGFRPGTESV